MPANERLLPDGSYEVDTPPSEQRSALQIALKSLRATAIASEKAASLKEFGLDKPRLRARLTVGAAKDTYTRALLVGQTKSGAAVQKTYAKRDESPIVYEVDKQIISDVEKQPFDLQNKSSKLPGCR